MSSGKSAAKRRRVGQLRASLPFISQEALAAISRENEAQPLPTCSRTDIRRARNEEVQTRTPYGTLHEVIDVPLNDSDTPLRLELQNPFAMLWYAITVSPGFNELVKATLQRCPCTFSAPWNLILYNDEVSPGNQLAFKNLRKLQAIYWSILELGPALSNEDVWFELVLIRSTVAKTIRAALSGLITSLIQFMFLDPSRNFQTSGVHATFDDGTSTTLFLKFGVTLADEGALHMIYESKGSSGLKCCAACSNVYDAHNQREIVESDDPGGPVLHTCCRAAKLCLMTPVLLCAIMSRLATAATVMGEDILYVYTYYAYVLVAKHNV